MNTAFTLSDSAANRVAWLLSKEPDPAQAILRISIQGGGCSGFQYQYDFEATAPQTEDAVIEKNGARVVIDSVSMDMLAGSELDYVEDMSGAMFVIKNPNSTAKCGCGNSFSVM